MSPEANSEQGQDQATKSKFDTSVHPEGVREFGKHGDLSEMARITEAGELKTNIPIPEHPGNIDPHTHEVEVEKVAPLEAPVKAPWYTRTSSKVAGLALVITAAAGGVAALGGGDKAEPNRTETSTSATPNPETAGPTAAELERAGLKAYPADEAMLSLDWYEPGGEVAENVDDTLLLNNLNKLLDNITYMRETGDFSAAELTFVTDGEGNFPTAAVDVEGIKQQNETNKQYQEESADYPVSSLRIGRIEDVQPAGFMTLKVTAITLESTYGAPAEGTEPTQFRNAIRTEYTIQTVPHQVSEGVEKDIWVIVSQVPLGEVDASEADFGQN